LHVWFAVMHAPAAALQFTSFVPFKTGVHPPLPSQSWHTGQSVLGVGSFPMATVWQPPDPLHPAW
jgi:hypothetical protein